MKKAEKLLRGQIMSALVELQLVCEFQPSASARLWAQSNQSLLERLQEAKVQLVPEDEITEQTKSILDKI